MGEILLSDASIKEALQRKAEWTAQGVKTPLRVNFITVDRQPEYIHATLQSFLESDPLAALLLPVNLIVGTSKADFVRPYEEKGVARVHAASEKEVTRMETFSVPADRRVHYKFGYNYWRGLYVGIHPTDKLLLFEDDVSFTRNWLQKFTLRATEAHALRPDDFALSLYSALEMEPGPDAILELVPSQFYGTQGIYYPPRLREKFIRYIWIHGIQMLTKAVDLMLRDYCLIDAHYFGTLRPSLIQHEGMITTGLSPDPTKCHRSPSFVS